MKTIDLLKARQSIFDDRIQRSKVMTTYIINHLAATPSRSQVRNATYAEMAANAISAWDSGNHAAALYWVGRNKVEEVTVQGQHVWLSWTDYPEHGCSPHGVERTSRLSDDPAACALAEHIVRSN